jgi:hypothetical protein
MITSEVITSATDVFAVPYSSAAVGYFVYFLSSILVDYAEHNGRPASEHHRISF